MLRCYNYNLLNDLKKSFILVLDSGYFPESWNRRIICTFYKSSPKYDPSNYRETALASCLGKLFSTHLLVRIENEAEKKKLLSKSQADFRKKLSNDRPYNDFVYLN